MASSPWGKSPMEEIADAVRCLCVWGWPLGSLCGQGACAGCLRALLVFGRIEGKMEEHSGVYECVYKTNPMIKGYLNISGNFICSWA